MMVDSEPRAQSYLWARLSWPLDDLRLQRRKNPKMQSQDVLLQEVRFPDAKSSSDICPAGDLMYSISKATGTQTPKAEFWLLKYILNLGRILVRLVYASTFLDQMLFALHIFDWMVCPRGEERYVWGYDACLAGISTCHTEPRGCVSVSPRARRHHAVKSIRTI